MHKIDKNGEIPEPVMVVLSPSEQLEFTNSLRKYLTKFQQLIWWNKLINTPNFYRDIPSYKEGDYVAIGGKYGFSHTMPLKVVKGMKNTHEAYVVARLKALILDTFVVGSHMGVYWQVATLSDYEEGKGIY